MVYFYFSYVDPWGVQPRPLQDLVVFVVVTGTIVVATFLSSLALFRPLHAWRGPLRRRAARGDPAALDAAPAHAGVHRVGDGRVLVRDGAPGRALHQPAGAGAPLRDGAGRRRRPRRARARALDRRARRAERALQRDGRGAQARGAHARALRPLREPRGGRAGARA